MNYEEKINALEAQIKELQEQVKSLEKTILQIKDCFKDWNGNPLF